MTRFTHNAGVRTVLEKCNQFAKRLIGADISAFSKDAFLVTTSYAVSTLRGIITSYLVARMFPRELYGTYQFMLTVLGIAGLVTLPGLSTAMTRALARGEEQETRAAMRWQLGISLIGSTGLLLCIPFLQMMGKAELWPLFILGSALLPLSQYAGALFATVTRGKGRFDISLKANIAWSVALIALILYIVFIQRSVALLLIGVIGFPAIAYLIFGWKLMPRYTHHASPREILRFAWTLSVSNLPGGLSWYLDKIMISAMFGLNQLAVFSIAVLIPEQMKSWAKELLPVSFAVQAKGDDTIKRRRSLVMVVLRATLAFSVFIAAYVVLAPYIFYWGFPTYYNSEAIFLTQMSGLTIILLPTTLLNQYIEAQALVRELRIIQWLSAAVFCISLITLIPMMGLLGAVLARGIVRLTTAICCVYVLWKLPAKDA